MELSLIYNAPKNEKPLDNLVTDGGFCSIFRTVACVGDSLSSGEHESCDENGKVGWNDYFEYSFGQYLARMAGTTVYNFSCGGMSAKDYVNGWAESKGYWSKDLAAQCYIMALGVNDLKTIDVGDITDVDTNDYNNNKDTFIGHYAKIIQRYKEIQPKAKFFLMTIPLYSSDEKNEKRDAHAEALYKLAELFDNTYVLDFRKYAPVYDENFRDLFFLGCHMNAAGYLVTAKMVASYIDYIIRHNMDDFRQVGFIGKGTYNAKYKW